jgi:hypothetical protein
LGGEADLVPRQRPALARHVSEELPAPAAVLVGAGDELAVGVPFGEARRPQRLRLRADEAVGSVTLEFATVAAVDEAVIRPAGAFEDQRLFAQVSH